MASAQVVATDEDTPVGITLAGSDPDGDSPTFGVVGGPEQGTLSGAAPDLIYIPDPGYTGPDSLTFTANDGQVDSVPATVSITVQATNRLPDAVDNVAATAPKGTPATIDVLENDLDPDPDPLP